MTKNEIFLIADFLNDLENKYGDSGCNDLSLPNTEENRDLVKKAEFELKRSVQIYEDRILTYDFIIVNYLKNKLINEYNTT